MSPTPTPADVALAYALQQVGKPYRWGGQGPSSYDCSGLVLASYAAAGLHFPDTTANGILDDCTTLSLAQTLPGDVIQPHPGHIMMVCTAGGGVIVEAPRTGLNVRVVNRWGGVYKVGRLKGARPPQLPGTGPFPIIACGTTGPLVVAVQDKLNRLGFDAGPADGIAGPRTIRAVKDFQVRHGLTPDGVIGPNTWKVLNSE